MKTFGLTGGIASGKSTVGKMLRERGVPVIDADLLAREVVEPGTPALADIAARWPGVVVEGRLDRPALGALVFSDPAARGALEAITHPRIAELGFQRRVAAEAAGHPFCIYEAALLVEKGLDRGMDGLIVVTVSPEVQLARVRSRDGFDAEQAAARLAAQAPLAEKVARATWRVDNDGDRGALERQVDALLPALARAAAGG